MRRTDAKCHGSFLRKIPDDPISLSRVKRKERRNIFCSIRKGGFMLRTKLRQKMSAISARRSAHNRQIGRPARTVFMLASISHSARMNKLSPRAFRRPEGNRRTARRLSPSNPFSPLSIGRHLQGQKAAECVRRETVIVVGGVGSRRRKSDMPVAGALAPIPNVAIANSAPCASNNLHSEFCDDHLSLTLINQTDSTPSAAFALAPW